MLLLGDNLREVNFPVHLDTKQLLKPQIRMAIKNATLIAGVGPDQWAGVVPPSHPPGAFALGEILAGKVPLVCGRGTPSGEWIIQNLEGSSNE